MAMEKATPSLIFRGHFPDGIGIGIGNLSDCNVAHVFSHVACGAKIYRKFWSHPKQH
jgi:hypothetical protein